MKYEIKVGDAMVEVPKSVFDHDAAQKAELTSATSKADALQVKVDQFPFEKKSKEKEEDEEEEEMSEDKGDALKLQAKIDTLEADAKVRKDGESARIDARVHLVNCASKVLGSDAPITGKSDAALMREVVLKVTPTMAAKLDQHKASPGYLLSCFDQAVATHTTTVDNAEELSDAIGSARSVDGPMSDISDALTDYRKTFSNDPHADYLAAQKGA